MALIHELRSRKEDNPQVGEIPIKVITRAPGSYYFRANHIPITSLLTWPRGNYELMKDVDKKTGQLVYYLMLRPDQY